MIYLDSQRATSPCKAFLERRETESYLFADLSSLHRLGKKAREVVLEAKEKIRSYLGAKENEEVTLSASYTEVLQILFAHIYENHLKTTGKNQILSVSSSSVELTRAASSLESRGCLVRKVPLLSTGQIDLAQFALQLTPKVGLVSLSYADDETGVVYPIYEIVRICKEKKVPIHVDITGVIGKIECHSSDLSLDYLTFSTQAIHGADSMGMLLSQETIDATPSVPLSLLAGTLVAIQQALLFLDRMGLEVVRLRDLLEESLQKSIGVISPFAKMPRLPHISALVFPKVHRESLAFMLQESGVFVHVGAERSLQFLEKESRFCLLSFALSRFTTETELVEAIEKIKSAYLKLSLLTKEIL